MKQIEWSYEKLKNIVWTDLKTIFKKMLIFHKKQRLLKRKTNSDAIQMQDRKS